jgi:CDP-glycerol glycerophosphotransferase (TagB/SpsB family)
MQDFKVENEKIIKEYGIDTTKKTILYAPAWEWDGHQLEIANAVKDLNVNLIIKQFPFDSGVYPWEVKLIEETHEKTRTLGLDNVFILDPKINIFNVIQIADVLVSEESSTLSEAMLLEKPVIAVEDWLVPDSYPNPARRPECFYDFAIKIEKKDLRNTIKTIISDESYKEKVVAYRNENFPNIGNAAKIVMDILDNVLYEANNAVPRIEELPLVPTPNEYKKTVARRKILMKHIYVKKNFVDKNQLLLGLWNFLRCFKNNLKKKLREGVN